MTTPPERDPAMEHLQLVRELLDASVDPPPAQMSGFRRAVLVLFVLWLATMAVASRWDHQADDPEWSGVSRVGGDR